MTPTLSSTPLRPTSTDRRSRLAVGVLLLAVAVGTLLLASPDSYTHDLYNRVDSAWYYICGKAWACGMRPYIDFTDSKGPLLWLIYALGYLISPRDYTGVYWLSCMAFWVTLLLSYRTARLFVGRRWALLCALLMVPAFLYPVIHEEVKTEDWAQPFVMASLYAVCRLVYGVAPAARTARRLLVAIGAGLGATLLIKYSFTTMLGVFALYALWYSPRSGVSRWSAVGWMGIGAAAVVVPLAALLAAQGCLGAMVDEYFVNTLRTLPRLRQTNGGLVEMVLRLTRTVPTTLFPLLCAASAVAGWRLLPGKRLLPVMVTAWFFALTLPNARWMYYYVICGFTLLFGVVAAVRTVSLRWRVPSAGALVATALAVTAFTGGAAIYYAPANFAGTAHPARQTYARYARLMAVSPHPTIIYWGTHSTGLETPAEGLPGCRYWAMQNGATPQMMVEASLAVASRRPQFVAVATSDSMRCSLLGLLGYQPHAYGLRDGAPTTAACDDQLLTVYSRDSLPEVPPIVPEPTITDILFRRHLH